MTATPDGPDMTPACSTPFVERSDVISSLHTGLTDRPLDTPQIVVLHGHHGVGRRTAVQHWAATAIRDYPGGRLHVDFTERRNPHGPAISDTLADCLGALGTPPDRIPLSLRQRTALFRAATAARPMLVTLDAVTEAAQVRWLTPLSPGSAVVVTSRAPLHELALDGAQLITVPPTSQSTSLALLRARCGAERVDAEPDAAVRLVDLCAGLPIALEVAAAILRAQPHMSISTLCSALTEENIRRTAVPPGTEPQLFAVCTVACAGLPNQATALYGRLGAAPVRTMTTDVIASAGQVEESEAHQLLKILTTARLIEALPHGQYRLHEAIRPHARAHATEHDPSALDEVPLDLIQHYLGMATLANADIMTADNYVDRDGHRAGPLKWLARNRHALLAVARAGLDLHCNFEVRLLAETMRWLYVHFGYVDHWLEAIDLGAAATKDCDDRFHQWRAQVHHDLGPTDHLPS